MRLDGVRVQAVGGNVHHAVYNDGVALEHPLGTVTLRQRLELPGDFEVFHGVRLI